MVILALLAEVVIIAVGNNQWVSKRAFDYAGAAMPASGFAHQFVYSTQALAWRVSPAAGESTTQWAATLVRIGVVLLLTALLVPLVVHAGSFWRAWAATVLIVVFATQAAAVVAAIVYRGAPFAAGFTSYYVPVTSRSLGSNVGIYQGRLVSTAGGRVTDALFEAPNGYRFIGGLALGALVGLVVGAVARRVGQTLRLSRAQSPGQPFFPAGDMQRTYESKLPTAPPLPSPLMSPGAIAPAWTEGGGQSAPEPYAPERYSPGSSEAGPSAPGRSGPGSPEADPSVPTQAGDGREPDGEQPGGQQPGGQQPGGQQPGGQQPEGEPPGGGRHSQG